MNIADYYSQDGDFICFNRPQSSDFAKDIAGDFNPLHDVDARRFCVPGDLLFAVILQQYGLANAMSFEFVNMVDSDIRLKRVELNNTIALCDSSDKEYIVVERSGSMTRDETLVNLLVGAYVRFSGRTFPYLLVDLMRNTGKMINRARPLVFYKSMELELEILSAESVKLEFTDSKMEPSGKKADVSLNFNILDGNRKIGFGSKKMVLGGLREFDQTEIDQLVADYQEVKNGYVKAV